MRNQIHNGDCFDVLEEIEENSVHSCVTDPPYGLAFMGKSWDDFEPKEYQDWCEKWATEVMRVLKPGGHLLAFSGNRTHHRLFTGVEDAGFEIRDTLTWHYGSGFPKASDIGKTIDKREGAEREVVGEYTAPDGKGRHGGRLEGDYESEDYGEYKGNAIEQTAPATEEAKKWDGWKTGLKPATEYVVLARKPFDGATVDCVLNHGTGALNIEACRVESDTVDADRDGEDSADRRYTDDGSTNFAAKPGPRGGSDKGRYPSNVVFHEGEAEKLDREVGELGVSSGGGDGNATEIYGTDVSDNRGEHDGSVGKGDSGGPSRYFYTSKASKAERTENGSIDNSHPTVKPIDLMEWLIKLVTREGQIVVDPFTGSGTTCKAAKQLNREFIGIEKQSKWADVARVRCGLTPDDPSVVRSDVNQNGLEQYTD